MTTSAFRSQFSLLGCTNQTANLPFVTPIDSTSLLNHSIYPSTLSKPTTASAKTFVCSKKLPTKTFNIDQQARFDCAPISQKPSETDLPPAGHVREFVMLGAVSVGVMWFFMGMDGQKALALGPEGPLVEEFWDNVRRYALYALTVSTGALYTIFQPIFELLKNPISAVLILLIFGGSIYIMSQVLSAMVGVSEFTYDYAY